MTSEIWQRAARTILKATSTAHSAQLLLMTDRWTRTVSSCSYSQAQCLQTTARRHCQIVLGIYISIYLQVWHMIMMGEKAALHISSNRLNQCTPALRKYCTQGKSRVHCVPYLLSILAARICSIRLKLI